MPDENVNTSRIINLWRWLGLVFWDRDRAERRLRR